MDLSGARWRKSSWSGGDGGECVEVATNVAGAVLVRDSKNVRGPVVVCADDGWAAFLQGVKAGRFAV
ncbi:DUF397 domain-containing protein [Sphaerisporangium rhizosphaerae]|uniref:DUF397 domain-containing protein n=1 Tax=Sphaerisporangium rhizosphaerae TaxID=2269375 RepID=A0ABW2P873_9ACTN